MVGSMHMLVDRASRDTFISIIFALKSILICSHPSCTTGDIHLEHADHFKTLHNEEPATVFGSEQDTKAMGYPLSCKKDGLRVSLPFVIVRFKSTRINSAQLKFGSSQTRLDSTRLDPSRLANYSHSSAQHQCDSENQLRHSLCFHAMLHNPCVWS